MFDATLHERLTGLTLPNGYATLNGEGTHVAIVQTVTPRKRAFQEWRELPESLRREFLEWQAADAVSYYGRKDRADALEDALRENIIEWLELS